ncbi:MAG TPA: helix-turn-helix domain-containing protein [Candidatus Limnocylindrales bacterium]|nr:helix-turn-helix domain-containing protein [Candidatus Limnocylindrales bacterium]
MSQYGQFCPVAKAMELLDERWTMLVVRELLEGSQTFNTLRRGIPRMSPALLSTRLQSLARAGVIDRIEDGSRVTYALTPAGRELRPIVEAIGRWGIRWIPELGDVDLDPHLLMWDIHRNVDLGQVPPGKTIVRFTFRDVVGSGRDWWLVIKASGVDLCDFDPGGSVAATVDTDLRTLTRVWRGDDGWPRALRSGQLRLEAPAQVRRAFPRWLKLSAFAPVPRPAVGGASALGA